MLEKKRCSRCKKRKPLDDFYNDRTQADGKTRRCRACAKKVSENWRATDAGRAKEKWRSASRKHERGPGMLRKYGIDEAGYQALFQAQAGKCAICGTPAEETKGRNPGRLVIDHDHKTKTVRGLLCGTCNVVLGLMRDDPASFERAAVYLQQSR